MARYLKFWLMVLAAYCGWIFYLSSGPIAIKMAFHGMDKVLHMIAYGIMAAMAWRVVRATTWRQHALGGAWLWCALYGASDEWHQSFTHRHPDVMDWLADVTGAGMVLLMIHLYLRFQRRQPFPDKATNT